MLGSLSDRQSSPCFVVCRIFQVADYAFIPLFFTKDYCCRCQVKVTNDEEDGSYEVALFLLIHITGSGLPPCQHDHEDNHSTICCWSHRQS